MRIDFVKKSKHNQITSICTAIHGNSKTILKDLRGTVDLIVTSPPYADARKNHYDSVHPDKFAEWFFEFHKPFYEALKPNGSFVLNIKDRVVNGTRHRYVWHTIELLTKNGWFAIDDYIWHKPNPMPGYWPTRLSDGWEYCFHLAKQKRPFFNRDAVKKPIGEWAETRLNNLSKNDLNRHNSENNSGFGRDISRWVGKKKVLPSNVITCALIGKNKKHPAVFPNAIPEFFIKLLCPEDGLVVDPFAGSGTTGVVALQLNRNCILIDNQKKYIDVCEERLRTEAKATIVPIDESSFPQKIHKAYQSAGSSEQLRLLEKYK